MATSLIIRSWRVLSGGQRVSEHESEVVYDADARVYRWACNNTVPCMNREEYANSTFAELVGFDVDRQIAVKGHEDSLAIARYTQSQNEAIARGEWPPAELVMEARAALGSGEVVDVMSGNSFSL